MILKIPTVSFARQERGPGGASPGRAQRFEKERTPMTEKSRSAFLPFLLGLFLLGMIEPAQALASGGEGGSSLLTGISASILAATVFAYFASMIRQPLILAYVLAGVVIGPQFGLGLVQSQEDIQTISEIGLILLLFIIGLELDLKKLKESGKSLIVTGVSQFLLCLAMGLGFFMLLGVTLGAASGQATYKILGITVNGGPYDLLYLAACLSLSSTAIVVKLLYDKFELDTLAGRITLGVLVFQDLWAIILLGVQPNLADPKVLLILWSFAKGGLLVLISLLISRYVLNIVFRQIAKLSELVLVASLGWCFFVCGVAHVFDLSVEMGALIAGVSISTFPYNLDIISKIVSIRDFFVTLFFVGLGMMIPNPMMNPGILFIALVVAAFLIATRFLSIFPVLYGLKNGHRVSLLSAINLSQLSEFALVIAAIGIKPEYGHVGPDTLSIVIFVFVITSITSTYMIQYSHRLQKGLSGLLSTLGIGDIRNAPSDAVDEDFKEIAILGFYRVASSLVREILDQKPELQDRIVVVDYNPTVHQKLKALGVKVYYGDISNMETLHHARIEGARVVVSTIPDSILVGTSNLKLIRQMQRLCPNARVVVTAENIKSALEMYNEGADYVILPRVITAGHFLPVLESLVRGEGKELKSGEMAKLKNRGEEVVLI